MNKINSRALQSGNLRFNTKNDAVRYVDHIMQRCHQWAATNGIRSLGEDYVQGENEIRLQCYVRTGRQSCDFKFRIRFAPTIETECEGALGLHDGPCELAPVLKLGRYNALVRHSRELGQSPENWIPSIVWLELHREGDESTINPFAFLLARSPEIGCALSEREIDAFGVDSSKFHRGITHGLIETKPSLLQYAGRQASNPGWKASLKSQCDDILASFTISVSENSVRAIVTERSALQVKLDKLFFSALD